MQPNLQLIEPTVFASGNLRELVVRPRFNKFSFLKNEYLVCFAYCAQAVRDDECCLASRRFASIRRSGQLTAMKKLKKT